MREPIVSICCVTYNHGPYLREALDSFLIQRDVPFEIVIHDDASTDDTVEIIREYAEKYPEIIRPMYEEENQYSKIPNVSAMFNFPRARGRYIAFCEGDDYWTDPAKLKKQVEIMDYHPDCVMCCHSAKVLEMGNTYRSYELIRPYNESHVLSPREVISHNIIIPSASMMFVTEYAKQLPQWYFDCPVGDAPLHLYMLLRGKIYYMDTPMSVYRLGRPGSWTADMMSEDRNAAERWETYYGDMERMYHAFNEEAGGLYTDEVEEALRRIRFFTDINEGKDEGIKKKENRMFLDELPKREAQLLRLRASMPGVYAFLRRTYLKRQKN